MQNKKTFSIEEIQRKLYQTTQRRDVIEPVLNSLRKNKREVHTQNQIIFNLKRSCDDGKLIERATKLFS